jgi:hypothetical protein
MQQTQPTSTPPDSVPEPAALRAGRMATYALVALAGSCLVMVSSFLPWIEYKIGAITFTGWDIGRHVGTSGLVSNVFRGGVVPMASGLATLILGALGAATAVLILWWLRQPLPDSRPVPRALTPVAIAVGVIVAAAASLNLISYFHDGAELGFSLGFGLVLLVIGGYVVLFGLTRAVGGPWQRLAAPSLGPSGSEIAGMNPHALLALAGSGLVMVSSFLPWIGMASVQGSSITGTGRIIYSEWTGWEIFSHWNGGFFKADVGSSLHYFHFSPLVTGLSTLILGVIGAAVAVMVLVSLRRPLPGRYPVRRALVVVACVVGLVLVVVPIFNVWSYLAFDLGYSLGTGLVVLLIGGFLALVGLVRAVGTRPKQVA